VRVGGGLSHLGHRDRGGEPGLDDTDRGCLRVGVDDVRYGLVIGLAGFAEDVGGGDFALVFADVRQQPYAGDVTDRPQPLASPQLRVDGDPMHVGFNADRFQAEPVHARRPVATSRWSPRSSPPLSRVRT